MDNCVLLCDQFCKLEGMGLNEGLLLSPTYQQTRCSRGCFTNTFVIDLLTQSSFVEISPNHANPQIVRARDLTF